jgi:hypothetical protein
MHVATWGSAKHVNSLVVKKPDALNPMDILHTNVLGIRKPQTHVPIVQNSMMKGKILDHVRRYGDD